IKGLFSGFLAVWARRASGRGGVSRVAGVFGRQGLRADRIRCGERMAALAEKSRNAGFCVSS
ncbi:MAG: hypothetical protein ACR2P6_02165, partial [Gammaproteobacteria bacterium]